MFGGAELKVLRRSRRWTQGDLAVRLGVTRVTVARWEDQADLPLLVRLALSSVVLGAPPIGEEVRW